MSSSVNTPVKKPAAKSPRSFLEQEREYKGGYSKEVFQVLRWAYGPHMLQIGFWVFLGWIGRILLLGNSVIMGVWMDVLGHRSSSSGAEVSIKGILGTWLQHYTNEQFLHLLFYLTLAGLLLTWAFRLGFSRLSVNAISSIYDEVTVRVSRYPMRFFDRTPVGRIVTRFSSDYGNMFRMFGGPLSEFFGIVFDLIASLFLLFSSHWLGLACYLFLLGINFMVYQTNKGRIRKARRDQSLLRSPGVAHFAETVQGASVIRVFGKGGIFFSRFRALDQQFIKAKKKAIFVNLSYAAQMMGTTYGIVLVSGLLGLWLVNIQKISAGNLANIMVLLSLAGTNFQMFFDWMAQLEEAFVGVERMNEYLRLPLEPEATLPSHVKFATGHAVAAAPPSHGSALHMVAQPYATPESMSLEMKDVWFRYEESLPWILKDMSFLIKPGEKVGIIGRTGAGKTTVFQVLQNFYPIERGQILFDKKQLSIAESRHCLAVIPQDPVLFTTTVRDNLAPTLEGQPRLTDEQLLQALVQVGLEPWLARHKKPLDVVIEEKGKNLSQGERQLMVMARMSLFNKPIVLMDEATSSIDPKTESALVNAMENFFKKRTQVIIAHRLSTIESCDRILWLMDGQVKLFDKPASVLSQFKGDEIGV